MTAAQIELWKVSHGTDVGCPVHLPLADPVLLHQASPDEYGAGGSHLFLSHRAGPREGTYKATDSPVFLCFSFYRINAFRRGELEMNQAQAGLCKPISNQNPNKC